MKKLSVILLLILLSLPAFCQRERRYYQDFAVANFNPTDKFFKVSYSKTRTSSEYEYEYVSDTSSFLLSLKTGVIYLGRTRFSNEKVYRHGLGLSRNSEGTYIYCTWKRDFENGRTILKMNDSTYVAAEYKLGSRIKGSEKAPASAEIEAMEKEITRITALEPYMFR